MVVIVDHESNVISDLDHRPTGGLNETEHPEGAHTGHISCARIQMISTPALNQHFAYGMDMACYDKLQMDTTAHRNWLTPYEILRGVNSGQAQYRPPSAVLH